MLEIPSAPAAPYRRPAQPPTPFVPTPFVPTPFVPTPFVPCRRLSGGMVLALSSRAGKGSGESVAMRRACEVKAAGEWDDASAIDRVALDAHERQRRRIVLTGEAGTT